MQHKESRRAAQVRTGICNDLRDAPDVIANLDRIKMWVERETGEEHTHVDVIRVLYKEYRRTREQQ